jgi:hypothetical protein
MYYIHTIPYTLIKTDKTIIFSKINFSEKYTNANYKNDDRFSLHTGNDKFNKFPALIMTDSRPHNHKHTKYVRI